MERRLAFIALYFLISCMLCQAQTSKDYPFYGIGGNHHKKDQSKGRNISDADSLDDEMDESEIADLAANTLRNVMPTVSLPLRSIKVSSLFGIRKDPMDRLRSRMHNGLDLKASYEDVFSMLPGIVTAASYSNNGGYYVTIKHGVCVCSYLHLSKIRVSVGQHVNAGDVIAVSGNSGRRTTGPHLHISCRLWSLMLICSGNQDKKKKRRTYSGKSWWEKECDDGAKFYGW